MKADPGEPYSSCEFHSINRGRRDMSRDPLDVWVVDDDQSVRWVLDKALRQAGMEVRSFERAEHVLEAMQAGTPDILITDVRMPGMTGIALLERLREQAPGLPIIVITAHADLENAVAAYKGGAFEYLPKPFDIDESGCGLSRCLVWQPSTQKLYWQ